MRAFRVSTALAAAKLSFAHPASAQDADDLNYGVDPARKLAIPALSFDTVGVAVRCLDGSFSVVLSGLPARYSMVDNLMPPTASRLPERD